MNLVHLLQCALIVVAALTLPSCSTAEGEPISESTRKLLTTFLSEFVSITPGQGQYPAKFSMGTSTGPTESQPDHEITISGPFHIHKYEMPQNLFQAVMGYNPSRWKGPRNSVESLAQREILEFCEKVTTLLHQSKLLPENEVIRLPTEAEWEYCCRAGTTTEYSFGEKSQADGETSPKASLLDKYAWHTGNAAGNDPAVGALVPNPWGLYDMHGYLWEHCQDNWHDDYTGAPSVSFPAWTGGKFKAIVLRGGSWKDTHDRLGSAFRRKESPAIRDDAIGFRCVRSAK